MGAGLMAAGPIGTSWAEDSWLDTTWEANSWADLGSVVAPSVFGDLTTLFAAYMQDLRDDNPTRTDTDTLIVQAQPAMRAATASPDDLSTAYAEFLS
jgi:hypothetical protein